MTAIFLNFQAVEETSISRLIEALPRLHSLDLSGTQSGMKLKDERMIMCAGENGCFRIELPRPTDDVMAPPIPSWINRLPLNYLGLWGCDINFEVRNADLASDF